MTNAHETAQEIVAAENLHESFETWIATVRDPSDERSEGERIVRTAGGKAEARYEIAPLPDGRFAVRFDVQYRCGDHRGRGVPWTAYGTREQCVATFLEQARTFFSAPIGTCDPDEDDEETSGNNTQCRAQRKILSLLDGDGLFGFLEPEPVKNETSETEPCGKPSAD